MAFRTNKVPAIEERTVSGSSVSFNSAFALPLKACKVSFSATQAGSGEPSPSNPRAISGVSAIGLTANSTPVSVSLGDTRYGGELDVLIGELTLLYKMIDLGSLTFDSYDSLNNVYQTMDITDAYRHGSTEYSNLMCEIYQEGLKTNTAPMYSITVNSAGHGANKSFIKDDRFNGDYTALHNAINGYKLVYKLAIPITIQLTPEQLSSIIGNNTFSTDTGTLEITFADLQEKSASGSVATFNTALAMPLASCNIAVNAWQEGSGDPYPAGGSAQIWDEEWEIGKYTDGVKDVAANRLRSKNIIPILPSTTYYFYTNTSVYNTWIVLWWYDENGNYLRPESVGANRSFTTPNDAYYMNFNTSQDWGSKDYANNFSFNYPATDTAYHPYSNIRPIHGFSEVNVYQRAVNLWDEEWVVGALNSSGGINPSETSRRTTSFISVVPNTTFRQASPQNAYGGRIAYYDKNKTLLLYNGNGVSGGTKTFTTPANCHYVRITIGSGYGTTYNNNISINYPSTDTDYHAYTGNIYTIQLGQEVYGAEVDAKNGVAHVDRAIKVLDGTHAVTVQQNYIKSDACCGIVTFNDIYPRVGVSSQPDLLCDKLKQSKAYNFWQNVGYPNVWGIINANVLINIDNTSLGVTDYTQETTTTVSAKIKAWLTDNNVHLIIPIEPFDIQLTPQQIATIRGNNTIFADTGDVDLTYKDLDIAKRGNFREVFKLPS